MSLNSECACIVYRKRENNKSVCLAFKGQEEVLAGWLLRGVPVKTGT
ncbi:MAG: hypothetical protein RBR69_05785 [Candidatus Cloacimonadaceae bacterium]|nr:hypothetical protein [Candidatus Cloacimonadota bacterium]MDY0127623.1 hypothetical protein [Candidatus Cloacimonadaceae bacterium]MCB5254953.1 hypothetical protein [Candidatus Cloacimonadota bacterium]MCK9178053.1 hypothetical protein [Candidatus Cloacimonadota bacterium]MCK9242446.1 hypothetical protein [Candidatus Cloacimonadota bacterium]